MTKRHTLILLIILMLALGIWLSWRDQNTPPAISGFLMNPPQIIQPFTLSRQGQPEFGLEQLKHQWTFMYFGFAHCPDVCPLTLGIFKQLAPKIKSTAPVQFVLVSVDPQRDTVDYLRQYVDYFNPDFVAVSGQEQQLQSLAKQVGVYFKVSKTADKITVDHSSTILLFNPQGQLAAVFTPPQTVEKLADDFQAIVEYTH